MRKFFCLILSLLFVCTLEAAPKKELWPKWQAHNPNSDKVINHQRFQRFLDHYLIQTPQQQTLVKYDSVSNIDHENLKAYLLEMSEINISQYNRDEQLAYWMNLYNALTLDVVLDHWPVKSIRKIKLGGWLSFGPWDAKLITIESEKLSLNDIEHRILRPIWQLSLVHYGVNCASIGCPNLPSQVFEGKKVMNQLIIAAKIFVNHPKGVKITPNGLVISQIYDWFEADFGGSKEQVLVHLSHYALPGLSAAINRGPRIQDYEYDWSINGF